MNRSAIQRESGCKNTYSASVYNILDFTKHDVKLCSVHRFYYARMINIEETTLITSRHSSLQGLIHQCELA
jgi:hypothetical protein